MVSALIHAASITHVMHTFVLHTMPQKAVAEENRIHGAEYNMRLDRSTITRNFCKRVANSDGSASKIFFYLAS